MYERKAGQVSIFEDATLFGGVRLDPGNKWIQISKLIPWEDFEEQYAAQFTNPSEGKPAKSACMAIGSIVINKHYGFSDEDITEEIRENPYLQYFLGYEEYSSVPPFDPRVLFWLIFERASRVAASSMLDRKVLPGCLCA